MKVTQTSFKNRRLGLFVSMTSIEEFVSMKFVATSHIKSPFDGVGRTIKQLATRASLQRLQNNQIMTATRLLEFCQEEICGIKVYFLDKDSLTLTRGS